MVEQVKVRFIEPQSRPGRPFNAWIRRWPLLGPVTLASVLERGGCDVQVYNENLSGPLEQNPEAMEDMRSADVIGVSIMTPTARRGYELADRLRTEAPQARIVFGGVHATFRPDEALAHGDVVVRGEGENVIQAVADGSIESGIVDSTPLEDLDALPPLNHFLIRDFDRLLELHRKRELYQLPVMTSRGCPYGCTYCSVTRMFGRKVRRQSVEKVHADLRRYTEQGFKRVFFYDDNFVTNRELTRKVLERMRPMNLRFNAQLRADFYWINRAAGKRDEALIKAMRQAGGDVIYVGYETVDDATAVHWDKGYRGDKPLAVRLAEDTRTLHEAGFWVHGMFVIGPQHDAEAAENIVAFSRNVGLESIQISILTPFPGTPLMEEMSDDLTLSDYPGDWDYYDGTHCVYGHGRLGPDELQQLLIHAHTKFYKWGGWSARRIRALVEDRMTVWDKILHFWDNARTARRTLSAWREEAYGFLELLRKRGIT